MRFRWRHGALGAVAALVVAWIVLHLPPPTDRQGLLPRFSALMNKAVGTGRPLDVSPDICGKISVSELAALHAEVGNDIVEYRPPVPGFWKSDKGDEWWIFKRRENLVFSRRLSIRMNSETGNCSARVSFETPYP